MYVLRRYGLWVPELDGKREALQYGRSRDSGQHK